MRFAYLGVGFLVLACGLGCRRHPLTEPDGGDSGPAVVDAPVFETGVDAGTDHGAGGDAADAKDAATKDARPGQLPACGELRALAAAGPFTPRHARNVLFSPDRRLLIVQAAGPPDDLLLVPLPEGVPRMLLAGGRDAEWLGGSGKVLATLSDSNDLVVVSLDGTPPRTIASRACAHLAVPDGSRVFVVRDCAGSVPMIGALDEIDVATGTVTPRAPKVTRELAVSSSGRFAAFVALTSASGGQGAGALHVLEGDRDQPLAPMPAGAPTFVSDQRLLFVVSGPGYDMKDAYVHVPGSGGDSQRIAESRNFGLNYFRISPDGSLVLAASWSNTHPPWDTSLLAVRLDGGGEQQLANDLLPYYAFQLAISPYTFSADGGSIVFIPSRGTTPLGVFAIPPTGGERRQLAPGSAFAVSRFADRVAIVEYPKQIIHVVAAATGVEALSFEPGGSVGGFSFLPDDRGLLCVVRTSPIDIEATQTHLTYVSFADGSRTLLGSWYRSQLPLGDYPQGEMRAGYPLDPTGCFTIVDSDLPESTGTSLVVLPDAPE